MAYVNSRPVLDQPQRRQGAAGGGGKVERRLAHVVGGVDLGPIVVQQHRQRVDGTHCSRRCAHV